MHGMETSIPHGVFRFRFYLQRGALDAGPGRSELSFRFVPKKDEATLLVWRSSARRAHTIIAQLAAALQDQVALLELEELLAQRTRAALAELGR